MIIGLNGKMGAGKDTVADWLVQTHGFRKVGFSDEMYAGICGLFGIDLETALAWKDSHKYGVTVRIRSPLFEHVSMSWREFIQNYGTAMGRKVWGEDFWVEMFEKKYLGDQYDDGNVSLVVRDVRFNNEAALLHRYGATIWEILRPGYEGDGHESEAGIDEKHIDGELTNDGTIDELHEMLNWWMEEIKL
jgi:hypothetical protein